MAGPTEQQFAKWKQRLVQAMADARALALWQPPPRRVIVECKGVVRQYRLGPGPQRAAAIAAAGIAVWIGWATYASLARDEILAAARADLAEAEGSRAGLERELDAARERIAELSDAAVRAEKSEAELASALEKLDTRDKQIEQVSAERDEAMVMHTTIAHKIDAYQSVQLAIAARLEEPLRRDIAALEDTFKKVGVSANTLLGRSGEGGPLVQPAAIEAMANYKGAGDCKAEVATALLADTVDRRERLRELVEKLPFGRPIKATDVTSGFGRRVDPISGQLAMHTGMDFRDEPGTPVMATAPGTVVQAGWGGEYGRQVEVRHAGGLVTRYAHLESVAVKIGDTVKAGTVIGKLGDTGRSTGPHLHYEVLLDGIARNPQPFVEGRRNVQQAPRSGS